VTDQDLAGTRIDPVFRQKMLTGSENADRSGYMREVPRQPLWSVRSANAHISPPNLPRSGAKRSITIYAATFNWLQLAAKA